MKNIFLFLLSLSILEIAACTCVGSNSLEKEFRNSDLVIVAEVLEVQKIKIWSDTSYAMWKYDSKKDTVSLEEYKFNEVNYGIHLLEFTVIIHQNFKEKTALDTIKIRTGFGEGDCGYPFQIGEKYLIFGTNEFNVTYSEHKLNRSRSELIGIYRTSICDLTAPFEDSKNVIEILNRN
jgi:hypothetical protein